MKAFKYRSISQLEFILDILVNRRLYCADFNSLNDPMEGIFEISGWKWEPFTNRHRDINKVISRYKICSLSANLDNFLLWSHYAGGHRGVAIEVELPDNDPLIKKVDYRASEFPDLSEGADDDRIAQAVLFSKHKVWNYEKEIRILTKDHFYEIPKITKVVVGRLQDATLKILQSICKQEGILLEEITITGDKLKAKTFEIREITDVFEDMP